MIADILALYEILDKKLSKASVLKAFFRWDGIQISGDKTTVLRVHGNPNSDKIWFYEVAPYNDFIFVPLPVNPAVNFDFGKDGTSPNSDSKYFRFVASPLAKFSIDGEENVKTDFIIIGYKPDDLISGLIKTG